MQRSKRPWLRDRKGDADVSSPLEHAPLCVRARVRFVGRRLWPASARAEGACFAVAYLRSLVHLRFHRPADFLPHAFDDPRCFFDVAIVCSKQVARPIFAEHRRKIVGAASAISFQQTGPFRSKTLHASGLSARLGLRFHLIDSCWFQIKSMNGNRFRNFLDENKTLD